MKRNATQPELANVGCLVVLGVTSSVLVLPVTLIVGFENITRAVSSIDWTSFSTFRRSLWNWARYGGSSAQSFIWVFGFCYGVLVWQWLAQMYGWPRFLSGKRLWAASSIYFLVLEGAFTHFALQQRRVGPEDWALILIPVVFLMLTLPLWWVRIKK